MKISLTAVFSCFLATLFLSGCNRSSEWPTSSDAAYAVALNPECIEPNATQREKTLLALEVLEVFDATSEIYKGAALNFMRGDNWRCHDEGIDERAAFLLTESGYLQRNIRNRRLMSVAHRLVEYDLQIETALANLAFQSDPVASSVSKDVRPEALSILASLSPQRTAKYKERAAALMGNKNSLQTGAAQLAAASGDPGVLKEVARLLEEVVPTKAGTVLRRPENEHVIELAYAFLAAGEAANPYLPILDKLLSMKVESASHFGLLELAPRGVCRVYRGIGSEAAKMRLERPPCSEKYDWKLLPQ